MRYLRRSTALVAFGAGASLALTACGSSGSSAEGIALDDEQTINVWGWSGAPGAETMADVIAAFEDQHPNITVDYNEVANTDYANQATLGLKPSRTST